MTHIYRCEREDADKRNPRKRSLTKRPPGNVPYVVDNLWEWKRPDGYPCRRHAVFASPTPELAKESAQNKGKVFTVEPKGHAVLAQIPQKDAKFHPDCTDVKRKLANLMMRKGWIDLPMEEKRIIAPLWAPCLLKEEVEELFNIEPLKSIRDEMWDSITFWNSVKIFKFGDKLPYEEGEVFFEADEWLLHPAEA